MAAFEGFIWQKPPSGLPVTLFSVVVTVGRHFSRAEFDGRQGLDLVLGIERAVFHKVPALCPKSDAGRRVVFPLRLFNGGGLRLLR